MSGQRWKYNNNTQTTNNFHFKDLKICFLFLSTDV